MTDAAVALVRRLELEVCRDGRLGVLDEIAADTYTVHDIGLARTIPGRAAVRAHIESWRLAFAIADIVVHDIVASGDRVVVRWTIHATHVGTFAGIPPTGRATETREVDVFRVEDNRLAEAWVIANTIDVEEPISGATIAEPAVAAWIDAYARAWRDGDADAAAALFSEDAIYRSTPFRAPHIGRDGIRHYWREEPARHEHVDLRFGAPVVHGRRVAVEWWVTIIQDGKTVTGPGCLVLRFDAAGRCEELREYWQEQAGRVEPPPGWGT